MYVRSFLLVYFQPLYEYLYLILHKCCACCYPPCSHQPTLDRQQKLTAEDDQPLTGEGSEYGRQRREEARRRKRGYAMRKEDPDDRPWVLKEQKRGGKQLSSQEDMQGWLVPVWKQSTSRKGVVGG